MRASESKINSGVGGRSSIGEAAKEQDYCGRVDLIAHGPRSGNVVAGFEEGDVEEADELTEDLL